MTHSNTSAAPLLVENLSLFESLAVGTEILDLACGNGRNGLVLADMGFAVTFADRDREALKQVAGDARFNQASCRIWTLDLEEADSAALAGKAFDAILVFNYLHRPLLPAIKAAVRQGGLVMYETFTVAQRKFGRPRNPDFLLKPGELLSYFENWQILQNFEGETGDQSTAPTRAVANIIARRPESG